jgi:hypothetical protein
MSQNHVAVESSLSHAEFAKCMMFGAGLNAYTQISSLGAIFFQQLYNQTAVFTVYDDEMTKIWRVFIPQNKLIYILKHNKYMLPDTIYVQAPQIAPIDSHSDDYDYFVDLSTSEITDLLVARGYFPYRFFVCNDIFRRAIFSQFYDAECEKQNNEISRYYIYKLNILLRAMMNSSHQEIVRRYMFWESQFRSNMRHPIEPQVRDELNAIETQYLRRFSMLYPAILFAHHKQRSSNEWYMITIAELHQILRFSDDVEYQKHVETHLRKYLSKIYLHIIRSDNKSVIRYMHEISDMIFHEYPQYIHTAIFNSEQNFIMSSGYISYMPTFYDDHTTAGLTLFVKHNIERCPNLHKFISTYRITRDQIINILRHYPIPNNPIAKYVDDLAACIAKHKNDVDLESIYYMLIHDADIYRTYFIPLRSSNLELIQQHAADTNKFRRILAESVAENPQLFSHIGVTSEFNMANELLGMVGEIDRLKVKYIYSMTYIAIDIRHMIAHNFIHRNNNGADDFARYLRITSDN